MASVFLKLARKVLDAEKCPLTINEIWAMAKEKGYDKELVTSGKTPWATLGYLSPAEFELVSGY